MSTDRETELEVKVAFLEHHVATLDATLREALDRIEGLGRELRSLMDRVETMPQGEGGGGHEPPPHHLPRPLDG